MYKLNYNLLLNNNKIKCKWKFRETEQVSGEGNKNERLTGMKEKTNLKLM